MPAVDWSNPIGGLETTLSEAQAATSFTILVPRDLSSPQVLVRQLEPGNSVVDLLYQSDCGPIEVTQRAASDTDDGFRKEMENAVAMFKGEDPNWPGWAEQTTILGDVEAFVSIAPGNATTTIRWQKDEVEISIRGVGLSAEQVINLAQGV